MPLLQQWCNRPNFTQQAYRYGIGLSCIGVVLNWLGVADSAIEHIRYLGVFLVIVGSFLILSSMCRWMVAGPPTPVRTSSRDVTEDNDFQVIADQIHQSQQPPANDPGGNPPDYHQVVEKPPSYDQVMTCYLSPTAFTINSDSSLPPYSPRFDVMAGYNRASDPNSDDLHETRKTNHNDGASSSLPSIFTEPRKPESRVFSDPLSLDNEHPLSGENAFGQRREGVGGSTSDGSATSEVLLRPQNLYALDMRSGNKRNSEPLSRSLHNLTEPSQNTLMSSTRLSGSSVA